MPEFMKEAKRQKTKLKHLEEYRSRIELIQDFQYPVSASNIKISPDEKFIITGGK